MRADVSALVIGVDCQVETHQFDELGIVEAHHGGEIGRPVLLRIDGTHVAVMETIAIDHGSNSGQFGNKIKRILQSILQKKITYYFYFFIIYYLPVFGLVYSLCIGFGELALALQSRYRGAELAHGMQIIRKIIYHADDVGRQIGSRRPILRKIIDLENKIRESAKFIFYLYLLFSGNLSGDKKPKEPLGQRLLTSGSFGKKLKKNFTKKIANN